MNNKLMYHCLKMKESCSRIVSDPSFAENADLLSQLSSITFLVDDERCQLLH